MNIEHFDEANIAFKWNFVDERRIRLSGRKGNKIVIEYGENLKELTKKIKRAHNTFKAPLE